jgi:hypothetical protein
MIVGKNSAKLGFTWYVKTIVKCVSGIAVIVLSIPNYPYLSILGVLAFALGVYEALKEYNALSAVKPVASGEYKMNVNKDEITAGYYPEQSKDDNTASEK